jgi:hypothetical protein
MTLRAQKTYTGGATQTAQITDEISRCEAQLSAAIRVLPIQAGKKRTATEYKITFLQGKINTLNGFLN